MTTTDTDRAWSDGDHRDRRAWTGPVAAALGLVLAVLAVFAIAKTMTGSGDDTTNAAPTAAPVAPVAAGGDSICGLTSGEPGQPVTSAPDATWQYAGTTAYPTSPTNGPVATATPGYRYCFPHTTEGALFAAANALAVPDTTEALASWSDYFIADGPNRGMLDQLGQSAGAGNMRFEVIGFRVLNANADSARIDLAVNVSTASRTSKGAFVYALVWENGDWKLSGTATSPMAFTDLPDTTGYITWGP